MTTETIEWFTLEEKMPGVRMPIVMKFVGFVTYGWFDGEDYVMDDGSVMILPQFWAHKPKGPE